MDVIDWTIADQNDSNYSQQSVNLSVHTYKYTFEPQTIKETWKPKKRTRSKLDIEYRHAGTIKFDHSGAVKIFGARMREARDLCNMTLSDAAKLLGYKNPSKLCKVELGTDTRAVPLWLVLRAAKLYDVSADFLFGLSDDWERDPVVYQQKQVGKWLFTHWQNANTAQVNAMRVLYNRQGVIMKAVSMLLGRTQENLKHMNHVREINKGFDDSIRGGSKLLRLLAETAEDAMGISHELQKMRALSDVAKKDNVNLDIFEDVE